MADKNRLLTRFLCFGGIKLALSFIFWSLVYWVRFWKIFSLSLLNVLDTFCALISGHAGVAQVTVWWDCEILEILNYNRNNTLNITVIFYHFPVKVGICKWCSTWVLGVKGASGDLWTLHRERCTFLTGQREYADLYI